MKGFFPPQLQAVMLNEWQRRAVNAIMFGNNYMLIAEDPDGSAFIDLNTSDDLFQKGLRCLCENDPKMLDFLTDLVIDLHTQKKQS